MKKIVHISSAHGLFDNRIFWKECKSLNEKYDLTLIIPYNKSGVIEGIRVIGLQSETSRVKRMLIATFNAYRHAVKEDATLYHLHDPELIPVGLLLRLRGKQVIFDMHENTPKSIRSKRWVPERIRTLTSSLYSILERITLNRFGVIFAEESYERDYPWIQTSEKVLNMPKVHQIVQIQEEKKQTPTIGYIGRIGYKRGSITMLNTLAVLKQRGREVHFDCVGNIAKDHLSLLEKKIQQNELSVRLHGFLKSEKGLRIISACHIGMGVLKPVPNYLESMPTKILEYMSLGIPVITSNFPLYKNIVEKEECGICVDPENEEEIADAIEWLIDHPNQAKEMGKKGRQAVLEKYSWENEAKRLHAFYKELIGDHSQYNQATDAANRL